MTDKQLKQAKKQLNDKYYGDELRISQNLKFSITPEDKMAFEELRCIGMINSILAYQGAGMSDAEEVMQMQERRCKNYLDDYVEILGRDKVVALIQAQINDIAYVVQNVGTDSEGLTYNAIVWKEDLQ